MSLILKGFSASKTVPPALLLKARKFDHATHLLRDLHWLPVILFKVAFKSIHNLSPQYISNMFSFLTQSNYSLRSRTDPLLLKIPKINSKKCEQTISFAGPKIWNGLPLENSFLYNSSNI